MEGRKEQIQKFLFLVDLIVYTIYFKTLKFNIYYLV